MKNPHLDMVDQHLPAGRWPAVLAIGVLSILVACGGGADPSDPQTDGLLGSSGADAPSVSAISPDTAILGASTRFTVSGQNLPLTAILSMNGYRCPPPSDLTPTGFTVVCDATSTMRDDSIFARISTAHDGTTIDRSHSITVSDTTTFGGLTDTGISTLRASACYSAGPYTHLGSCTEAQKTAFPDQQDAMIGRDATAPYDADGMLGFSYSKVGAYAKSLCVRDNVTGLMWEIKSSTDPLRRKQDKYTNYGDNRAGDASAFVVSVNATGLCGYNDWRLPSRHELQSLVNYGVTRAGPPVIDFMWFPEFLAEPFWTSSSGPKAYMRESSTEKFAIEAWYVSFATGAIHRDLHGAAHHVRLVR